MPHSGLVLAFLSLGVAMVVMDTTIVNVALPPIREDFGPLEVSITDLQWVVNSYVLAFAVALLPAGTLADMFGRRLIFRIGLVLFTAASIACGLAGDIDALVAFRALQGIGAALIMPTTLSILQVSFPVHRLAWAIGIWSAVVGMSTAIGPLVGGVLAEHVDWRWVFYINVPLGVITLAATFLWIRESRGQAQNQRLDFAGVFTSGLALFCLTYGLLKANDFGWGDPRTIGLLAAAVAGLAGFVMLEGRQRMPMVDLSLFRSATFSGANVVAVVAGFVLLGMLFNLSVFIQDVMGYSSTETGAALLPLMLMLVVVAPHMGKLVGRFGTRVLLTVGMALLGISLMLFAQLDFGSTFFEMVPAMLVGGIGLSLVLTPLTAAALSGVPMHQAGIGAAIINATRQVGGSLGLAVLGAISAEVEAGKLIEGNAGPEAYVDGFSVAMLAGGAFAFVGAVVAWLTIARPARAPAEAPVVEEEDAVEVEHAASWGVAVSPTVITKLPPSLAAQLAAARGLPTLDVVDGPAAGARIILSEEPTVLGRTQTGAAGLGKDPELSRRHASLVPRDGRVAVEDLGSTHGTLVNGEPISGETLAEPGDEIEVGSSKLVVVAPAKLPKERRAETAEIEVATGELAGTRIKVAGAVVFGRAEEGPGNLGNDPELSRRHASIAPLDPGRLLVEDLGSTNGTLVKEHRIVAPTVVRAGDVLELGSTTLRVVPGDGDGLGVGAES